MMAGTFLVLASLLAVSHCAHDLSQTYRFSSQLRPGDDYTLYWSFDAETRNISFAVRVRTMGWVGFGLSPNGQMPNSDVVIGWVDSSGRAYLQVNFFRLITNLIAFFQVK